MKRKFIFALTLPFIISTNVFAIDLKEELNNTKLEKQELHNTILKKLNKKTFFNIMKKRYYSEKRFNLKQKTLFIENGPFMAFDEDGDIINTGSLFQDVKEKENSRIVKLESWYIINVILVNSYKLNLKGYENDEDFQKKIFEIFRNFTDAAVKYYTFTEQPLDKLTQEDYKKELLASLGRIDDLKTKYSSGSIYYSLRDPLYNFALDFNAFLESIEEDYFNEYEKIEDRKDKKKFRPKR